MKVERIARALGSKLISIHFKNGGTMMVGEDTTYPAESLLHAKGLMELDVEDMNTGQVIVCALTPFGILGTSIPVKEIFVNKNFLDVETSNSMGVCYDEDEES